MVECKYRGRVIGWLFMGANGFLKYASPRTPKGKLMMEHDPWKTT